MAVQEPARYSVQILLPDEIDSRLRNWCKNAPGATWPAWGGHVTVLPAFHPAEPLYRIEEAIAGVASGFAPFQVSLDHVRCRPHLVRPALCIVFLTTHRRRPAGLWDLHQQLMNAVSPMALPEWDRLWRGPFRPHVSLTTGLSSEAADRLLESTIRDNLQISFEVDQVYLMRHSETAPEATPVATFAFAGAGHTGTAAQTGR